MPNLKQHSKRIRLSLAWFECVKTQDPAVFLNPLINEYFYCALHMFEAAACTFNFMTQTDFYSHLERNEELGRIRVNPLHPLVKMAAPYETLASLSRRSRYIQISEKLPAAPIKSKDLKTAQESFAIVQQTVESVFIKHHATQSALWTKKDESTD